MKRKLYYVVEKELQSVGDVEETTGHKSVTVYEIDDVFREPKLFVELSLLNEDSSVEQITNYLDDNGMSDEEFELIRLY
jgi:hypothetical protein